MLINRQSFYDDLLYKLFTKIYFYVIKYWCTIELHAKLFIVKPEMKVSKVRT